MTRKIKVLLVDDHAIVRMGLASLLGTQRNIEVVGEADDGVTALKLARNLEPDVVILDLMMPGMSGDAVTAELHRTQPDVKVLILTSFGTADALAKAMQAGAAGAVMKSIDFSELVDAIQTVAAGGEVLAPEIRQFIGESKISPTLTERQLAILAAAVQGLSNVEIGNKFNISAETAKKHLSVVFAKIGASSRTEAVAIALRKQLVKM